MAYGFDQASLRSQLPAACCALDLISRGQHHAHYRLQRRVSPKAIEHFHSIRTGHLFIEQKKAIGTSRGGCSQKLCKPGFPGITQVWFHLPLTSYFREDASIRGVVINDQGGYPLQIVFTRDGRAWLGSGAPLKWS